MQQKFITNILLVLLLNVIVKPFYILGIDAEVLKRTGDDYGVYFSLLGLTFMLNVFLDLGLVNYNTRNIAQHRHLLDKYFHRIVVIRLMLSIGYFIMVGILALLLRYPLDYYPLLGVLALNQVLVAFVLFFRSNLSGLLLFKQDSFVSVIDRVVLIVVLSYLLWWKGEGEFNIMWFAYAQLFAYCVALAVAMYLVYKNISRKQRFEKVKKVFAIAVFKESVPYALLVFLMMIYYRSDAVMLERMLENGKEETAIYAQGYRFFEAFNMLGYLFAGLLLPLFARMLKKKEEVFDLVGLSFRMIMAVAITLFLVTFLYREEIILWRYGTLESGAAESFGVLMVCFVFVSMSYVFGTLLTANGNLKILNRLALVGVVLNLGLNYLLIPLYGAFGAALASLFTQFVTAWGQFFVARKEVGKVMEKEIWKTLSVFVGIMLLGYVLFDVYIEWNWFYSYVAFGVYGVLVAFTTGMLDIKKGIKLLKI